MEFVTAGVIGGGNLTLALVNERFAGLFLQMNAGAALPADRLG
jgi:hypothetical protein